MRLKHESYQLNEFIPLVLCQMTAREHVYLHEIISSVRKTLFLDDKSPTNQAFCFSFLASIKTSRVE